MSTELSTQVHTPMQMIQVAFDAAIKQGSAMEVVNLILEQQKWMIQHLHGAALLDRCVEGHLNHLHGGMYLG